MKFGFKHNSETEKYEVFEYDEKALNIGLYKIKRDVAEFDWYHEALVSCEALNIDWNEKNRQKEI